MAYTYFKDEESEDSGSQTLSDPTDASIKRSEILSFGVKLQ